MNRQSFFRHEIQRGGSISQTQRGRKKEKGELRAKNMTSANEKAPRIQLVLSPESSWAPGRKEELGAEMEKRAAFSGGGEEVKENLNQRASGGT